MTVFIVAQNLTPSVAIQVCHELSTENRVRETKGLLPAMEEFNIPKGLIITTEQEDTVVEAGKRIKIVPFDKLDKYLAAGPLPTCRVVATFTIEDAIRMKMTVASPTAA